MVAIRNWKDSGPTVSHDNAIIWRIFRERGTEGRTYEEAPLEGILSLTLHMLQGGKSGDYHAHEASEQVYYFTRGRGRMKIDGETYDVKEGDAVHVPPRSRHQLINDSEDWIEHLIVTAGVREK